MNVLSLLWVGSFFIWY